MKFSLILASVNCVSLNSPFDGVAIQTALDSRTWPAPEDDERQDMAEGTNMRNYMEAGPGEAYTQGMRFD